MKKYINLPIHIFFIYSLIVFLSLSISPTIYQDINYPSLALFLTPLILLFAIGFKIGSQNSLNSLNTENAIILQKSNLTTIQKKYRQLVILALISSFTSLTALIAGNIDLNINKLGESYVRVYEGYERGKATIDASYVLNILSRALTIIYFLFSIYYYRALTPKHKLLTWFIISSHLFYYIVGSGKMKYLGDIIIFIIYAKTLDIASTHKILKKTSIFFIILSLLVGIFFLVEILSQRYAFAEIDLTNVHEKLNPLLSWDENKLILNLLPNEYAFGTAMFLNYLTSGLYGLSLSLSLPFEWSYLVGNSYSISRIMEKLFDIPDLIYANTYPFRVGEMFGWGESKWHSLFAWMASDITFPGVLLFSTLFGYFYAKIWIDAIKVVNPYAGPLFIYLSLGVIFCYSNNQLLHSLEGTIVLLFLIFSYFKARRCIPENSSPKNQEVKPDPKRFLS
jgi:hypothetical protein